MTVAEYRDVTQSVNDLFAQLDDNLVLWRMI